MSAFNKKTNTAIVLFSGGLDSTTCLYWARARFDQVIALSFDYGQKHSAELDGARRIAQNLGVRHVILPIDVAGFGASALVGDSAVPDYAPNDTPPITYVPARNTVFLAYALALAESVSAGHIVIGVSSVDYSGYPDCRADFIKAFEHTANLGTQIGRNASACGRVGIQIHAPLQHLDKRQTIAMGLDLGVDYASTVSCYRADSLGRACGACDSCHYRRQGFLALGNDPTRYAIGDI